MIECGSEEIEPMTGGEIGREAKKGKEKKCDATRLSRKGNETRPARATRPSRESANVEWIDDVKISKRRKRSRWGGLSKQRERNEHPSKPVLHLSGRERDVHHRGEGSEGWVRGRGRLVVVGWGRSGCC